MNSTQGHTLTYRAAGKLMLFGEYLVLRGAKSLAFPLKYGQTLEITPATRQITWQAFSPQGEWFRAILNEQLEITETNNQDAAQILKSCFKYIRFSNPELHLFNDFKITADFELKWGFGSSSTFISAISQWGKVDPYQLQKDTFKGSGYDIACATAQSPIVYWTNDKEPGSKEVVLSDNCTSKMLFIYLGQKQISRNEIERFQQTDLTEADINMMNKIISDSLEASSIEEFENCLDRSEDLLSPILGRQKLKDNIFADYKYSVKSLGAWGGDFFLATYRDLEEAKSYFKSKGLDTMFTYKELVI